MMWDHKPETDRARREADEGKCASPSNRLAGLESFVAALYEQSGAAQFDISAGDFFRILGETAENYLSVEDEQVSVRDLLSKLHLQDLILARACAAGHERAWEILLARYREYLYQTAVSVAKNEAIGRELADSLYASLYCSGSRASSNLSKLNSYTGVGSLAGWLRTVLAHAYVDRYRRECRLVPLEAEHDDDPRLITPPAELTTSVDPRLEKATDEALGSLSPEEGFVLVCYFLDGQTLSDIACTLKLHESTVSRRIEKITLGLRKKIRAALLRQGMSRVQAEEALQTDVRDLQVNVSAQLRKSLQENHTGSFSKQRVSSSVQ